MTKAKIIILRIAVFFLVFVGVVFGINHFMSNNPFSAVHDAGSDIKVWLDTNGNGLQDVGEPFMPNVCVWAGYASSFRSASKWQEVCGKQYFKTDSRGEWSEFFAGGSCSQIYSAINPPEHYFPTTPTIVNGCSAKFGLSQDKPAHQVESPDVGQYLQEQNQKEITIFRVKIGIAIGLISAFAGFVSFKIIRPVMQKAG